jgi:hypothetical protein
MWVHLQRRNYKKFHTGLYRGGMTQEKIDRLNGIGFDFDPLLTAWNKSFVSFIGHRVLSALCLALMVGVLIIIIMLNHWVRQISLGTCKNMATVWCHVDMNQTHPLEFGCKINVKITRDIKVVTIATV